MSGNDAFLKLIQQVQLEQQAARDIGAAHLKAGRLSEAQQAIDRARLIEKLVLELQGLCSRWDALTPLPPVPIPQLPKKLSQSEFEEFLPPPVRGRRTPVDHYHLPVLQALVDLGGRATVERTLERVGQLMAGILNEYDRLMLNGGGSIRWRNTAQWARLALVEEGYLKKNMPRGYWEISPEGKAFLEKKLARK